MTVRLDSLLLMTAIWATGCAGEELVHALDEAQATRVMVALDQVGIPAQKSREDDGDGLWQISVSAGDAAAARRVLAERELPRPFTTGFKEVFGKGSLVPTPLEERARLLHALSGELSRSLESLDGVLEARVHLTISPEDPTRPDRNAMGRAAVLVKTVSGARAQIGTQVADIQSLVAGAVTGLTPSDVAVVVAEAGIGPPARSASATIAHAAGVVHSGGFGHGLAIAAALAALTGLITLFVALRSRRASRAAP